MAKQQKARASTQEHLDIEDIVDDLVLMKNGWVALVMSTTAVNFDLLSEAEQDATIYAYGALLNSLTFPLEILIRSKKADITTYFQSLEEAENAQPNPDLKLQIRKYQDFIRSTVQQRTVLDKKFYLIINFSPLELGFRGLTAKKATQKSKSQLIADAKVALMPKRDHIIKQTARLGLITKQLTTQELIELFYDIYNPAPTGTQRVLLDNSSYTTPIVEPAVEVPTPAPIEQLTVHSSQFTESNQNTSQQSGQMKEPSTVNRKLPTDLRPVPPPAPTQPSQPATSYQTPTTNLPTHQANALKGLQETTARAAQLARPSTSTTINTQTGNTQSMSGSDSTYR